MNIYTAVSNAANRSFSIAARSYRRTQHGAQVIPGSALTVRSFSGKHSASMRFIADLADPQHATLRLPMGKSSNPASTWFMDQWNSWHRGVSLPLPFGAATAALKDTLVLAP